MTDGPLDHVAALVAKETTIIDSTTVLIRALAEHVRALREKPDCSPTMIAAANKLADDMDAKAQSIAHAVASNTPRPAPQAGTGSTTPV